MDPSEIERIYNIRKQNMKIINTVSMHVEKFYQRRDAITAVATSK